MPKPRHTGAHVCPLCLFLCPTKTSLTKHLDDVCFCPLPKRTCSQCRRVHKAAADLITCLHEENPDTETIPCCVKNCKIEASSVTEFAHHYRQKHGRDAPLYENSAISSTTSSGVFPPPRIGAAAAKLARATSQESAPVPPGTPSQPNRNDFRAYGSPMRVVEEHTPPAIAPFTFPQHRRLVLDGKLIDVVLRLEDDRPAVRGLAERLAVDPRKSACVRFAIEHILQRTEDRGIFLRDEDGYRLEYERVEWEDRDKWVYMANGEKMKCGLRYIFTLCTPPPLTVSDVEALSQIGAHAPSERNTPNGKTPATANGSPSARGGFLTEPRQLASYKVLDTPLPTEEERETTPARHPPQPSNAPAPGPSSAPPPRHQYQHQPPDPQPGPSSAPPRPIRRRWSPQKGPTPSRIRTGTTPAFDDDQQDPHIYANHLPNPNLDPNPNTNINSHQPTPVTAPYRRLFPTTNTAATTTPRPSSAPTPKTRHPLLSPTSLTSPRSALKRKRGSYDITLPMRTTTDPVSLFSPAGTRRRSAVIPRELSEDDRQTILEAFREIPGAGEGGAGASPTKITIHRTIVMRQSLVSSLMTPIKRFFGADRDRSADDE